MKKNVSRQMLLVCRMIHCRTQSNLEPDMEKIWNMSAIRLLGNENAHTPISKNVHTL